MPIDTDIDRNGDPFGAENIALIDAIVNAHVGAPMPEREAHKLLYMLGMEMDEADELLAACRIEASQP